jgi:hypothetical protein
MRIRGRAAEVAVLQEAVDAAASGRLAMVLIEGEPGIGKTRLLAEALSQARSLGLQVVAGRAEELEQTRPFGLLASAFRCVRSSRDPRRARIAGLLSAGADGTREPITVTSDPGLRFTAVDAFADLAEELALSGSLLIGIDDLQWADPSSLLTLAALSRRLAYLPVALVACLRSAPRPAELDRLVVALETAGARRLALTRLAEDAVRELVADAVAVEPDPELMAEISPAAGNPLFVTELLAALAQDGAITTSGGRPKTGKMALPLTLRLTIVRRLGFLPEETLQVLQVASVLGSTFTLIDLATVMSRSAFELSATLAQALSTHVVEGDGAHLRFRHDLIRDAIYEDLPLSVRRALHREAGRRLAAGGVFGQWIELGEFSLDMFRGILGTLQRGFSHVALFSFGYDAILLASNDPLALDWRELERRFFQPRVEAGLREVGFDDPLALLQTFFAGGEQLKRFGENYPRFHTDENLWLEYAMPLEIFSPRARFHPGELIASLVPGRLSALTGMVPGFPLETFTGRLADEPLLDFPEQGLEVLERWLVELRARHQDPLANRALRRYLARVPAGRRHAARRALFDDARAAMARRDWGTAERLLRLYVEPSRDREGRVEGLVELARAQRRGGHAEEALKTLRLARREDPVRPDSYREEIEILRELRKLDEARALAREVRRYRPDDPAL